MTTGEERAAIVRRLTGRDGPFATGAARIRGIDLSVYTAAPDSIRDVLVTGERWGERPALTFEDERHSWADYLRSVGLFAGALVERYGIKPGDRVAVAARNYPEWVMAFSATVSVGAICVPLNAWWTGPELAHALADCAAAVVVADAERSASIQRERGRLPALRRVIEVRPEGAGTGDDTWADVLAGQSRSLDLSAIPIAADDDATIMYTSGTTGKPKGAVATHRAHLTTMLNMQLYGQVEGELRNARGRGTPPVPGIPTALVAGPLFHVASLPRVISAATTGGHIVLMHKWDARRAVELIQREGVDAVPGGVPTVLTSLLDEVERTGAQLPSLRTLTSGGTPIPSSLVARVGSVFERRVSIGSGYGLTETSGPMVMIGSDDFFDRPQSTGRTFPVTEIRVVGDDGDDVERGRIGEAWLRGPNAAYRYWNLKSDAFDSEGWFHSGDLVRVDDEGFVYVVDRIKDVVIRAGENVYCAEVEDVLSDHPGVQDSVVLGRPHELLGEEVVAVVRTRAGLCVTADDLCLHVKQRLAAFKVPAAIYLQDDDFPRNAVGKVLKRDVREQLAARDRADAPSNPRVR